MSKKRQRLIRQADKIFSLYIRNRGAPYGYNHCFTCGVYLPVDQLQCGHFRPRRFLSTRWHPFNCWPQCYTCNITKGGNLERYEQKLVAQYGQDAVDGIYELSTETKGVTEEDLKKIIKKYKLLLDN